MRSPVGHARARVPLVWLATVGSLLACTQRTPVLPRALTSTGALPDGLSYESVVAMGRGTVYETTSGDTRTAVTYSDTRECVRGCTPRMRVEAAVGTKTIDSSTTFAGGRIIGRFINLSDDPYPPLALNPRDTTYWYAYRTASGQLSALYVPAGAPREWRQDRFVIAAPHPTDTTKTARWVDDTTTIEGVRTVWTMAWGQCIRTCCGPSPMTRF